MSVGSAFRQLLGLQQDPASQAILGPAVAAVQGDGQPMQLTGATLNNGSAPAATPAPMPPMPTPPPLQGSPQPAPSQTQGGDDLPSLYNKLLASSKQEAGFNSGLSMIAAGFASPENRAALLQNANSIESNAPSQASNTLNTIVQLRQIQQQQAQRQALMASQAQSIPDAAKTLGISEQQATYLANSGKLAEALAAASKPDNEIKTFNDGTTVVINKKTSQVVANLGGQKIDDKGDPKQTLLLNEMRENYQKYGLPDPASTDPSDQKRWKDLTDRILAPGGQNISVGSPEKTIDAAHAAAVGKEGAAYISEGMPARDAISTLDSLSDALQASGGAYSGPFADKVVAGKEALSGLFGIKVDNLAPQEMAQNLGFTLATQAAKAISPRPSQLEFSKALSVKPGIFTSPEGAKAIISLNKQHYQDQLNLAGLAHDPENFKHMDQVSKQYYQTHPIMSPFDPNRALNQSDINTIYKSAGEPPPKPEPDDVAISYLKAHPDTAKQFDEVHGGGMARMVLGQ